MEFPFNSNIAYLNAEMKKVFIAFRADEPVIGTIYTNEKGEQRKVTRLFYPAGVITDMTVYSPKMAKDGGRDYHTPLATPGEPETKVLWSFEDEGGSCTGSEWFKWLGGGYETEKPVEPKPDPNVAAKNLAMVKARSKSMDQKVKDKKSK